MTKKRRTVSLDPEVDEILDKDGVNASQLVEKLVKNHATAGGDERAMLELRKDQIQSDISSLEGQLEQKRNDLERVEEQLSTYQTQAERVIADAAEELENTRLEESNPAVQNWADKTELDTAVFLERLRDYIDTTS